MTNDAIGNLKKWPKYAQEHGNSSAIYPDLVYGKVTRYARKGVDVTP